MSDLLLDTVRSFANRDLAAQSATIDTADEISGRLLGALRELGLLGLSTADLDVVSLLTVVEELARANAGVALLVVTPEGAVGDTRATVGLRGLRTGVDARSRDTLFQYAVAAAAIGAAQYAHDETLLYLSARRAFGRPLIEMPVLSHAVSEDGNRLTRVRRAVHASARADDTADIQAVTLEATRCATAVAYGAIELHGGYGYMCEYPFERIARDCVSLRALVAPRFAST